MAPPCDYVESQGYNDRVPGDEFKDSMMKSSRENRCYLCEGRIGSSVVPAGNTRDMVLRLGPVEKTHGPTVKECKEEMHRSIQTQVGFPA